MFATANFMPCRIRDVIDNRAAERALRAVAIGRKANVEIAEAQKKRWAAKQKAAKQNCLTGN
jgi:hypothetical protein